MKPLRPIFVIIGGSFCTAAVCAGILPWVIPDMQTVKGAALLGLAAMGGSFPIFFMCGLAVLPKTLPENADAVIKGLGKAGRYVGLAILVFGGAGIALPEFASTESMNILSAACLILAFAAVHAAMFVSGRRDHYRLMQRATHTQANGRGS